MIFHRLEQFLSPLIESGNITTALIAQDSSQEKVTTIKILSALSR